MFLSGLGLYVHCRALIRFCGVCSSGGAAACLAGVVRHSGGGQLSRAAAFVVCIRSGGVLSCRCGVGVNH